MRDAILRDLRDSWRRMRRPPGTSFAVIASLGVAMAASATNCSFVNALTYARCRCPTRTARHREVLGMRMMGTYCSQCPASCAPITGAIVGRPSASSSLGALRRPLRGCGLDESCAPPELATK